MGPEPSAFVARLLAALGDYDETEAERILDEVVPCAPGERHDIALLAFSVLMRREGWQVR